MRDDRWLADHLESIWQEHFNDCPRPNEVVARFGRLSRTRLGSIGMNGWRDNHRRLVYRGRLGSPDGASVITLTGYFRDLTVPESVITATLAHELVHYIHGFHSPLPQLFRHPHQGGIVERELASRGLTAHVRLQKDWLKKAWPNFVGRPVKIIRRRYHVRLPFLSA